LEDEAADGKKYASASSISLGGMSGSEAGEEIRDEDNTFMSLDVGCCSRRGDDDDADDIERVDDSVSVSESDDDSRGSTNDVAVCVRLMMVANHGTAMRV
jgi:hypothetical protein